MITWTCWLHNPFTINTDWSLYIQSILLVVVRNTNTSHIDPCSNSRIDSFEKPIELYSGFNWIFYSKLISLCGRITSIHNITFNVLLDFQITIEKSPAYFVTDRVPERMWAMNSSLRLLLIVRDPVVRLVSDYAQLAENRRMRRESAHRDYKNKVWVY